MGRVRAQATEGAVVSKRKKPKKWRNPEVKTFYTSWEWKKIRYDVLRYYGAVCMLCHSTERIVVDHIKSRH
jgi:hypothetical protein